MIDEGNDSGFDSTCHDRTRQNRIFSLIFRGSGENGAWSGRDWKYYYNNRNELWNGESVWINPDSESGWDLFSLHVERLTANYSPDQSDQFMSALPQ